MINRTRHVAKHIREKERFLFVCRHDQVSVVKNKLVTRNWIEKSRVRPNSDAGVVVILRGYIVVAHDNTIKCTKNISQTACQQIYSTPYLLYSTKNSVSFFLSFLCFSFLFFLSFYSFLFSSFFFFLLLIDEMAFLPCVEVIPEHTERAARIKQSRVKNDVILKAKN